MLFILFVVILLSSCGQKELSEDSFVDIHANMTETQIEKILGNPVRVLNDAEKVRKIDESEDEDSTDSFISRYPDTIIDFFKTKAEKKKLLELMAKSNKLYAYEYNYKEESETYKWYIYFVEGKVVWMSFP